MQTNIFSPPSQESVPKPTADIKIHPSWKTVLNEEFSKPYFAELTAFVKKEIQSGQIVYPPPKDIFSAFDACRFDDVKVVILGQDPYHGRGQANGMCFSVSEGVRTPPSLQNMFKELHNDLGLSIPSHGNLEHWARQGVLLLNATLTVRAGQPNSHAGKGWETFTDSVIQAISDHKTGVVFLLWGRYAQQKGAVIDRTKHHVLTAAHPSPFSANNGFFGCHHFSKTNELLAAEGKEVIEWAIK